MSDLTLDEIQKNILYTICKEILMKRTKLTNLLLSLILVLTITFTNASVPNDSREAVGNAHLYAENSPYSEIEKE